MGASEARTAGRYARSLEQKGYLRRTRRRGTTNKFDLEPLFEKVGALPVTRSDVARIEESRELRFRSREEATAESELGL